MLQVNISQSTPNRLQVDLNCANGELHALVGPSGSGKTSVLRTIAGLNQSAIGRIECNGDIWFKKDIQNSQLISQTPAQRSCGFLFQQYALFPHLTALNNVCIALQNSHASNKERKQIATELLTNMGIADLALRMPNQLSGGQQQRVALARALARKPKALLLDEPFSAIDTPTRQGLYQTLSDIRKELNIPILLVTHDLREAELLADNITVIDQGIGLQTASPQTLFKKPRNSRVAELVGMSNLFHGTFNLGSLHWHGCDYVFTVQDKGKIPAGTAVAWVIPQSGLSVHEAPTGSSVPALVSQMSALGQIAVIQFQVMSSIQPLIWEASAAEIRRLKMEIGKQMHIEFDGNQIHIMPLRPINDPRLLQNVAGT